MMSSEEFIKEKINLLYEAFPNLKIRYEHRKSISTHIVEILPVSYFDSDVDCLLFQASIDNEFEKLFGKKEDILFISEDSLNEIREACHSWGYSPSLITEKWSIDYYRIAEFNLINDLNKSVTVDNTSYALAA